MLLEDKLPAGKGVDLVLIHPHTRREVYQGLANEFAAKEPPFLAALTASFIRREGYNVGIIDADAEDLSAADTAKKVQECNPRLVGIIVHGQQPSASAQLMPGVRNFCNEIRNLIPEQRIFLSGLHPSALPERTLQEESCNFVVKGEGFYPILHLVQGGEYAKIPGLFRRDNGKIIAPRMLVRDIPEKDLAILLPDVAWDLLPMKTYKAHNWHCFDDPERRQPYASMYTSFGCPFKCTFCCINSPFERNSIRCFNPDSVLKNIDVLVNEQGVQNIKFIDEMFFLRPDHVGAINKGLIERGYGLNIWAYARVDTTQNEKLLEESRRAGFRWLGIGIESGSKQVRDGVEKGRFGEQDILKNLERVRNAGIYAGGNYIFGLSDDTHETMQQTLDLALALKTPWANFYSAVAYPGSTFHVQGSATSRAMREKGSDAIQFINQENARVESLNAQNPKNSQHLPYLAVPKGWNPNRALLPEDAGGSGWIGYSQHAYEAWPLPTQTLMPEEVLKFRDEAFLRYFTDERYLDVIRSTFGEPTVQHIKRMTELPRLKRKILGD